MRTCVLVAMGLGLAACTDRTLGLSADGGIADGGGDGADTEGDSAGESGGPDGDGLEPLFVEPVRKLDLLLVVDDSPSMGEEQGELVEAVEKVVRLLDEIGVSYRVAMTTTDRGNPWCTTTPEDGRFVGSSCRSRLDDFVFDPADLDMRDDACRDRCSDSLVELPILPSAVDGLVHPWIERVEGTTNLASGVAPADAIACMLPPGIAGCGFESPLEAMARALTRARTPGEPEYGFVRDDAVLAVVFVTDEVDGSTNPDFQSIYLPESNRVFWSDPNAPAPTSAVVWNAGVECTGTSPYPECHAVDRDVDGNFVEPVDAAERAVLHPVARYLDRLQEIADAKQVAGLPPVVVQLIAGSNPNGSIEYADALDPLDQLNFGIGPGCETWQTRAIPPVRLRHVAEAFAVPNASPWFSICAVDLSGAFDPLVEMFANQLQPLCVPQCVADTDPTIPDVQPSCVVTQREPQPDGGEIWSQLVACTDDGDVPAGEDVCAVLLTASQSDWCADMGTNLELVLVRGDGLPPAGGTEVYIECELDPSCPGT